MSTPDEALEALYRAPLARFVAERGRLVAELRAAGDRAAAAAIAKRRRPTTSAWAVNQLYWHARDLFDLLLAAAARLRTGDREATRDHREALGTLRKRAATILEAAGHPPTEATLRRVTTTLSALAVGNGFAPDPPGALVADREAPGFDAFTAPDGATMPRRLTVVRPLPRADAGAAPRQAADAEARRRRDAERARRATERQRLEVKLRGARAELVARERTLTTVQRELAEAEAAVGQARVAVEAAETALESFAADGEA